MIQPKADDTEKFNKKVQTSQYFTKETAEIKPLIRLGDKKRFQHLIPGTKVLKERKVDRRDEKTVWNS